MLRGKRVVTKKTGYFLNSGIIHSRYFDSNTDKSYVDMVVIPRTCRNYVLVLAHDISWSGHLDQDKFKNHLLANYLSSTDLQ